MTELVDWALAEATARKLLRPGPAVEDAEAALIVADLRRLAVEATAHVERATQLHPVGDPGTIAVVDRGEWVRSNIASLRLMASPLLDRLADQARSSNALTLAAGRRITGIQIGTALAFLGGKVLGQYEVFLPDAAHGRLALVAPNIVATERSLGVDPHDFRLWVCLHEQAHRLQFTAVPWLRDHLERQIKDLAEATDLDPASIAGRLRGALGGLRSTEGGGRPALIEILQTPEQRIVMDRIQALMTLLEGHAEWAMDAVGPEVVPSVAEIRAAFDRRRGKTGGPIDRLLRRLLGLDLKMEQYRKGAAFVRAVVQSSGVGGLNTVWESPATLPTRAELADPTGWMRRVLGSAATLPTG